MNYEKMAKFIQDNNDLLSHITTWGTWRELDRKTIPILLKLIDEGYCHDFSNQDLYALYLKIYYDVRHGQDFEKYLTSDVPHEVVEKMIKT